MAKKLKAESKPLPKEKVVEEKTSPISIEKSIVLDAIAEVKTSKEFKEAVESLLKGKKIYNKSLDVTLSISLVASSPSNMMILQKITNNMAEKKDWVVLE